VENNNWYVLKFLSICHVQTLTLQKKKASPQSDFTQIQSLLQDLQGKKEWNIKTQSRIWFRQQFLMGN